MRVSSVLVLAILVAGCANRSKSLTRRQLSHCNEICGVQLRDVYKKQDLPRPLHREVSSEGELARKASAPKLHKTLGRERRLHCIRKCLERFNEPNKAAVSSEPERTRRRRATDSQKRHLECPKMGASSAVVYNWSAILTRSHGNWSIVVSWDPLKDPPLNWTGYSVAWNDVNKMRLNELVPFTCFVVPKNQTTLRITEQDGWIYPHSIQLVVTTYPTASRSSQVKKYHFLKATTATVTTTRTLSDFPVHVTPAVTMPLLPAAPDPSNETLLSSAYFPNASDQRSLSSTYLPNKNLTPGHIGAICVGIIVGVALVTGLLLRVRQIGSRSTKPRSEAQVFVSYSRADYKWVNENLLRLMDRHNITYLIDYKDFEPGRPWIETMVDCIQRSHKVLVIMSQEYMSRKNCQAELQHAMYWARGGKRLVVLRINNVDKGTLPGSIRNRTFIDYADMIERQTWKKRLVNILKTARLSNQPQISINFSSSDTSCETKV